MSKVTRAPNKVATAPQQKRQPYMNQRAQRDSSS
jgi:hypothetical protein